MNQVPNYQCHQLDETHKFWTGRLPDALLFDSAQFETLWNLHPPHYSEIIIHGRRVRTPRYQKAFGKDYRFAGQLSCAQPVPAMLAPFLDWSRQAIDAPTNGMLLNWYDPAHHHYIGPHRDSRSGLIPGSPIVTISLGGERTFRIRQWRGTSRFDFPIQNGDVVVMPWETNLVFTHEVPASARHNERRISITVRAFADAKSINESSTQ